MPASHPKIQHVTLHAAAPQKPLCGEPCNGCGVCCAAEPCSLAAVLLRQQQGSCRALQWDGVAGRYYCGLVRTPQHYRRWLAPVSGMVCRVFKRWIAADTVCDSDAEVEEAL